MLVNLLLGMLPQSLEPSPAVVEIGQEVSITARRADGSPWPQLPIRVRAPGGAEDAAAVSDAQGIARFVPKAPGWHELWARPAAGPTLHVALHVVPAARRWLYALLLLPAACGFLYWQWRTRRRGPW
jgi:hypothetical protein